MSEATVILYSPSFPPLRTYTNIPKLYSLDTSSHMRNSDYPPTRQLSQRDAITLLFQAKTAQNPESVNALMTMTKGKTEVLVSFTNEIGRVLTAEHAIQVGGRLSLTEGISVAQVRVENIWPLSRVVCELVSSLDFVMTVNSTRTTLYGPSSMIDWTDQINVSMPYAMIYPSGGRGDPLMT